MKLFFQGRMGLKMESIKKKDELKKILSYFEKESKPSRNGAAVRKEAV
jgi:hypothetical protein